MRLFVKSLLLSAICLFLEHNVLAQKKQPNIILFYVDDLGYGDLSCYGATSVKTKQVDLLAKNGIQFTDAHCTASTCTPSRFSLLTGVYAFRNNASVLPGDAPLIIKPEMPTVASMLQRNGYKTAVVGKWHLGLGNGKINWNGSISPGPNEIGFGYSFIIPATTDRVPTVFVENGKVPNLDLSDSIKVQYDKILGDEPTGLTHPNLLKQKADAQHSNTITNGISRIGYMTGGKAARWIDEEIPFVLNQKAKTFIQDNVSNPFFLFYPFPNIHVPRTPNKKFVGATTMGARGDAIAEMDWMVGEIMHQLDSLKLLENTIVIFSSDNGPVLDDGYEDQAEQLVGNHKPAGIYRGGKYSAYEAGTRVPMIVQWKGKIKPNKSKALVSQVDLYKTLATLLNFPLLSQEAKDSQNQLKSWMGKSLIGRNWLLEESYTLSIRNAKWKYINPHEKGTPSWLVNKKVETGLMKTEQLYDLIKDPQEKNNLLLTNVAEAQKLKLQLKSVIERK